MTHSKTQLPDGISQEILTCNLGGMRVRSSYQLKGSEVLKVTRNTFLEWFRGSLLLATSEPLNHSKEVFLFSNDWMM